MSSTGSQVQADPRPTAPLSPAQHSHSCHPNQMDQSWVLLRSCSSHLASVDQTPCQVQLYLLARRWGAGISLYKIETFKALVFIPAPAGSSLGSDLQFSWWMVSRDSLQPRKTITCAPPSTDPALSCSPRKMHPVLTPDRDKDEMEIHMEQQCLLPDAAVSLRKSTCLQSQ